MKKLILLMLIICLCANAVLLASCSKKSEQSKDSEDTKSAETNEVATEEPTEEATELQSTDIVINGVAFNSSLKNELKNAKTYGEICELLNGGGELVGGYEIVYEWQIRDENNQIDYIWIKFKFTKDGFIVCEDYRETAEKLQLSPKLAELSDEVSKQITLGKSLEEIVSLLQSRWELMVGDRPCYRWSNLEQGITIDVYLRQYYGSFNGGEVPDNINDFEIAFVDLGDEQNTNNMAENGMLKLKSGQSISKIQEILGVRAISLASGLGYKFCFDDESVLICYSYRNPYIENDNTLDSAIFSGHLNITK